MAILFDNTAAEIATSVLSVVLAVILYYKWAFTYWKNKHLPFPEPSIPFGTLEKNALKIKKCLGLHLKRQYEVLKAQGHKHGGLYSLTSPYYMPIHPEYIKYVMAQDFHHFTERGFYYNEKDDPLSANLLTLGGARWKSLRSTLSPAYTPGKMKMMFETLLQCGYEIRNAIDMVYENKQEVDIKELASSYTIDVIGSCAFGIECNCFRNPDAEFKKQGKRIFDFTSIVRRAKALFSFSYPNAARCLGVSLMSKQNTEFFVNVVRDVVNFRKTNNVFRKDMIQLLMELQGAAQGDVNLGRNAIVELAAQVFIFFAAGFESSSTTLTFCLYELSLNSTIQDKVRDEVHHVLAKHEGKITYEAIMDLKYMNQVVDETLRKYAPVTFTTRKCVKRYRIPGTETVLDEGTDVVISILGLHHDAEYFPEPEKFDPERFSEEKKKQRPPFTYMPFGEGPRICIGIRFGLMEIKVALALLLARYKFSLNEKTVIPIEMEPFSLLLMPKTSIFLDIERIPSSLQP